MPADVSAWLDGFRREQSTQTRLAYVRAAATDGASAIVGGRSVAVLAPVAETDVRRAVAALHPPVFGNTWTLNCAVRRGVAARRATPDGSAVFGSRAAIERRRKGLISPEEWKRQRLLPFVSYGDRVYRGNRNAKLVLTCGVGEVAARALPTDPLPKKRHREATKGGRRGHWLRNAAPEGAALTDVLGKDVRVTALRLTLGGETRLVPLTNHRGKQGRLLARVAWAGSAGLANVTVQVDDKCVHVTFDPAAIAHHPERKAPTSFVPGRALGIDRNPNALGGAVLDVARHKGVARQDLAGTVVDHLLVVPNLDRYASAEEATEAMAKAAEAFVAFARRHRCGTIVVESLRLGGGRTKSRRLNHLLSRWCRERFLLNLRRRATLAGIRVLEVWAAYSTTVGNVAYDLPDACASGAEMARRGLALMATAAGEKPRLLPAYDAGHVLGRLKGLPPTPPKAPVRRKEGTRAASRTSHEVRLSRLLARAEHVAGWKELHRALTKSGVRARRPHPTRSSGVVVAARLGPSPRGRCFRKRCPEAGGTRGLG